MNSAESIAHRARMYSLKGKHEEAIILYHYLQWIIDRYQQAINILVDAMEKTGDEETREMQKRVNMYLEEAECVKEAMKEESKKISNTGDLKDSYLHSTEQTSNMDVDSVDEYDNPIYNVFSGIGSAVIAVGRGVRE